MGKEHCTRKFVYLSMLCAARTLPRDDITPPPPKPMDTATKAVVVMEPTGTSMDGTENSNESTMCLQPVMFIWHDGHGLCAVIMVTLSMPKVFVFYLLVVCVG